MRREALGIAVAVLMAIGLGVGYFAGVDRASTVTVTSVSTSVETVTLGPPYPAASLETANLTVGQNPTAIGVDQNLARIYVARADSDNLTVVSDQPYSVVGTIQLPAASDGGIATNFTTHMAYAQVMGGVAEIDGLTDQVVGELHVNFFPGTMMYDPWTDSVYGVQNSTLVGVSVKSGATVANVSLGFAASSAAFDASEQSEQTFFAAGCSSPIGLVCNSMVSVVNGNSGKLVATVTVDGGYPAITVNTNTDVAYVSGEFYISAVNGTNGDVIFQVNPQTCGPFDSMTFVPETDELAAVSNSYNYTFVYNGATGSMVDMYSLPGAPVAVAYNVLTNELYVTLSSDLLAFRDVAGLGYMDTALVGSGLECGVP